MRLTPRCPVGNALNDLFCVPKQMGAEIPSAEQRFSQQLPGRAEVASAETGLRELLFGSREKLGEVIARRHAADPNAASRRCPGGAGVGCGMRRETRRMCGRRPFRVRPAQ